ncbi:MAG: IspD/TarI family cytidylyltransferase, partial [Candidatus Dormibacteraceae bacterium]
VHDAARPLASAALIRRVLDGVAETGAALPGLAPRDAVREVAGGLLTGALDRRALILAQTPQGFDRGLLEAAHARADGDGPEADDDAQLVWELGHPVAVVAGDEMNLKVTIPADLMLAELRLRTLSVGAGAPRQVSPPGVTA